MDDIKPYLVCLSVGSTYKRYKDDTKSIAEWLVDNALKCGHRIAPQVPDPPPNPRDTGRLKGKARKLARIAAKASPPVPEYIFKVSDFQSMASTIAAFTPKVKIPKALDRLFDRTIGARCKTTARYEKYGDDDSIREKNRRHRHFTNVLSNTWSILSPFDPKQKPLDPDSSPSTKPDTEQQHRDETGTKENGEDGTVGLFNRFSCLAVEYTAEEDDTDSSDAQETTFKLSSSFRVTIVEDEEEVMDDFLFAIECFLLEIQDVRVVLRRVWNKYREDGLELGAASLITNTAIHLVRKAEQQLDTMIQRPQKYPASRYPVWTFPRILVYELEETFPSHDPEFTDPDFFIKPKTIDAFKRVDGRHAELCMWDVSNGLSYFLMSVKPERERTLVDDAPTTSCRAIEMATCFLVTTMDFKHPHAEDEISRGIKIMLDTATIPIWVVFGMQTLLDAQDELASVPQKALEEVQQHTRRKLEDFENLDFSGAGCGQLHTEIVKKALGIFKEYTLGDYYADVFTRFLGAEDASIPHPTMPGTGDDGFLKLNPVRCGTLKLALYHFYHMHGVAFERARLDMTILAHVYIACRCLFPDDPVWPDLELLFHNQNIDHLFIGGRPKSLQESCKKMALAFGLPVSLFARNRRSVNNAQQQLNHKNARCLANKSPFDVNFSDWIIDGEATAKNMESWFMDVMATVHDPKVFKEAARKAAVPAETEKYYSDVFTRWEHTIEHTLYLMDWHVRLGSAEHYFDWFSMERTCDRIWRQILAHHDVQGRDPCTSAFNVALDMINEGMTAEVHVANTRQDNLESKRELSPGLVKAWEIIRSSFEEPVRGFASELEHGEKQMIWAGDREIYKILRTTVEDGPYPAVVLSHLMEELYRHWSAESLDQSFVNSVLKVKDASEEEGMSSGEEGMSSGEQEHEASNSEDAES